MNDTPRGDTREPAEQGCQAEIWPAWANRWIPCGSPVTNGRCAKYGHEQPAEPPGDAGQAQGVAAFLDWLISMDDPEDMEGRAERQVVTLTRIIDRARSVRALLGTDTPRQGPPR